MDVPGAVGDTAVEAGAVTLESSTGQVAAFIARPGDGPATRGGIIVIHEAFGLNDHIRDVTRRFAAAGYDALAPDLYTRCGTPDPSDMSDLFAKMLGVPDSEAVADLEAAAGALRALDTSNGKVGVIGFCSGGRHSLLFACSSTAPTAAVYCWGGFVDRASPDDVTLPTRPIPVIDLLDGVECPLFLIGGAEDDNPSPAVVVEIADRLKRRGKPVDVEIFDDAGHAFLADYRSSYRPTAAHKLWGELIEFFRTHLA